MSATKLSDLPAFPGKQELIDAQKLAVSILGSLHLDGTAITLLALTMIVAELRDRVDQLEKRS